MTSGPIVSPHPAWYNHRATKLNRLNGKELPEEAAHFLWPLAEGMSCDGGSYEERRSKCNDALTLYLGTNAHGTFGGAHGTLSAALGALAPATDAAPTNVIQYCTDTLASHLCRQKVRPLWVTEKGDPELQRRAKNIQMAIEGQFDTIGLYGMAGIELCYHGLLFEGAGLQAIPDYVNNRVDHQIVWAHEFSIPVREARANNVRTWIRTYDIDRQVLLHRFRDKGPKVLEAIRTAPSVPQGLDVSLTDHMTEDRVMVREAWHLPSGFVDLTDPDVWTDKCEHDGRHVLCIESHDLINEAWPLSHTLVAWFTPLKKPGSHWSRGVPATLAPGQLKINEWNRRIDGILKLHAVPRLIVWAKAKLNKSKWTNDLASIITSSQPPGSSIMRLDASSVPVDLINRVDQLVAWCEKQVGLSELSIAAARPPGIDHAPGLQQLQDQESIRHTVAYRAWEQFHIDAARNEVEALRMLTRQNKDFRLIFGNAKQLYNERWADLDIERDRYQLRAWPTALLPLTPGARLSRAIDMLNSQLATPDEVLRMLDMPDIDAVMGDRTAESENIERMLDLAEDEGGVTAECMPHPYLNLEMALSMAKLRINRLEANGTPQPRIEGPRKFFEAVSKLIEDAQMKEAQLRAAGSRVGGLGGAPPIEAAPGTPPDPMAAPPGAAPPMPPGPPAPMPPPQPMPQA